MSSRDRPFAKGQSDLGHRAAPRPPTDVVWKASALRPTTPTYERVVEIRWGTLDPWCSAGLSAAVGGAGAVRQPARATGRPL